MTSKMELIASVIDKLNTKVTQLQLENVALKQERVSVAKKCVQLEKVVCELEEANFSQKSQIRELEQQILQQQRKTIWGVVSCLFVAAAVSVVYVVSRR